MKLIFKTSNFGHEIEMIIQKIKNKILYKIFNQKKIKRKQNVIKTMKIKSDIKINKKNNEGFNKKNYKKRAIKRMRTKIGLKIKIKCRGTKMKEKNQIKKRIKKNEN